MATGAVEAGDIVLYESNEESNQHGSECNPGRVEPNNDSQLGRKDEDVDRTNNAHAASQPGLFKQPACDRIRLPVHPDETPSADDIERLRPKQGNGSYKKQARFK